MPHTPSVDADGRQAGESPEAPGDDARVVSAELAARLRLASGRLSRRLRQEADDRYTPSQLSALTSIDRHGPLTLGELASLERVQPPSITRIVSALEAVELVSREIDPTDRRVSLVSITPKGRRDLDRGRSQWAAFLAARIGQLAPDERAALTAALPVLEQLVEDGD